MRWLYTLLGLFFFGLGAAGAFLPILPTVPFLLLASFCFANGSERYRAWFEGTKLYQKHLQSFVESRSMTLRSKLTILLPVTAMLLVSCVLVNNTIMWIGVGVLVLIKYLYFIFCIKTISSPNQDNVSDRRYRGRQ